MPSPGQLDYQKRHDYGARYSTPKPGAPPGAPQAGVAPEQERVRLPRRHEKELFAIVIELKGGSRMTVQCEDGKERMCRIPGRIRKRLWIKDGDYVVVKPWEVEADEKCDLEYRYTRAQSEALKARGILKF